MSQAKHKKIQDLELADEMNHYTDEVSAESEAADLLLGPSAGMVEVRLVIYMETK